MPVQRECGLLASHVYVLAMAAMPVQRACGLRQVTDVCSCVACARNTRQWWLPDRGWLFGFPGAVLVLSAAAAMECVVVAAVAGR